MSSDDDEDNARRSDIDVFAMAAVFVGIVIGDVNAALWSRGNFNYAFVLYAIASALIPAALAYGISRRASTIIATKFSLWFLVFCVVFLLLGIWQLPN